MPARLPMSGRQVSQLLGAPTASLSASSARPAEAAAIVAMTSARGIVMRRSIGESSCDWISAALLVSASSKSLYHFATPFLFRRFGHCSLARLVGAFDELADAVVHPVGVLL